MEQIDQPLSKAQRKELEAIGALSTQAFRAVIFVGVIFVLGLVFRSLQHTFLTSPPLWLIPTAVLAIGLYLRSGRWTGGRAFRRLVREDLNAGKASITIIEPVSVVEVEEREDEGPSFLIETSTGDTVLLTGQELDRYKRKNFPWSKIGVIEAPNSKRFFGLKRMGESIQVKGKIPPLSYEKAKEIGCFEQTFIILDGRKQEILGASDCRS